MEAIEKLPICNVRALSQFIRENYYKHVAFELRFDRLYWYNGNPGPEIIKKIMLNIIEHGISNVHKIGC